MKIGLGRAAECCRTRHIAIIGLTGVLVIIAIVIWIRSSLNLSADQLLADASAALKRKDYAAAESLADQIPPSAPEWIQAQLVAGEAAMRKERYDAAFERFRAIPRDGSKHAVQAAFACGEIARDQGELSTAEDAYRYVVSQQPAHAAAHERLAFLLGVTGRRWESLPHFLFLIRSGNATLETLALVGDLERPVEQFEYLQRSMQNEPDDLLVRLGLAAHAFAEGHSADARKSLAEIIKSAPDFTAAQAMLGELLSDGDDRAFNEWHAALPQSATESPDIWYVRGLWARRHGELRVAGRCFWETVRRTPTHRRGTYQLGQVLVSLGETRGQEFAERSSQLYELTQKLDSVLRSQGRHEPSLQRVTELMEATGRMWEACAWASIASQMYPRATWPRTTLGRRSKLLQDDTPQTLPSFNLTMKHDLSSYPGYEKLIGGSQTDRRDHADDHSGSMIQFAESIEAGIQFVYLNGSDASTPGARMFEQTGGGVAVLDFDADRWPDLFFTQGLEWKHGSIKPEPSNDLRDQLYRNIDGQRFQDVTHPLHISDGEFGQGCAAGDFDNDGFTDLYVANIGRNRLYRNNGDGTFLDITVAAGMEQEVWTASNVIVDLNADGCPDLFDATYLDGDQVYQAICNGHACSPKVFAGLPDRLFISRGDGAFTLAADIPDPSLAEKSKGLGVVAVDLHAQGRPSLLVANDQVPNFFLRNTEADNAFNIQFQEEGFLGGLAYNADGLAMASMGIAADDANGDGRIDFYVTTFKDESSILYLQDVNGLFIDATNQSGLRAPSLPYVGWGTQFLDADCDGNPDLVATNGHVDDYRSEGGQYHMRPQFFRNVGAGRFVELLGNKVGVFFDQEFLGRGLARVDWNRDGRMDFVVSNIGAPASLVTNRTAGIGHFLNVRLVATHSARDAIGSVVEVVTEKRSWTKQLVAGDGYMASNERVLQFGLGPSAEIKELRVNWPSGGQTTVRTIPVDSQLKIIEGHSDAIGWDQSGITWHTRAEP